MVSRLVRSVLQRHKTTIQRLFTNTRQKDEPERKTQSGFVECEHPISIRQAIKCDKGNKKTKGNNMGVAEVRWPGSGKFK